MFLRLYSFLDSQFCDKTSYCFASYHDIVVVIKHFNIKGLILNVQHGIEIAIDK